MKSFKTLQVMSYLIIILTLISTGFGLFWQTEGEPFYLQSVFGEEVKIFGSGIYAHDNYFNAPINMGTDVVTLFVFLPLFILSVFLNKKNSFRYRLLHLGLLAYILYYAASIAFGVAFNNLYLVYLLLFSASLFTFILTAVSIDLQKLKKKIKTGFPQRGTAAFMILAGLSVFVWLSEIVAFLTSGTPPAGLGIRTTEPTFILDIGIIAPSAFMAAVFLMKKNAWGYLIAPVLLVLNALIGLVVISQTVFQRMYGVEISIGQLIAFSGIFVAMSLAASLFLVKSLQNIED
jgi:hypothetical protein